MLMNAGALLYDEVERLQRRIGWGIGWFLGKTSCGLRLGPVSFDTIFGAIPTFILAYQLTPCCWHMLAL